MERDPIVLFRRAALATLAVAALTLIPSCRSERPAEPGYLLGSLDGGPEPDGEEIEPSLPPPKEYPVNEEYRVQGDRVTEGADKESVALRPDALRSTWRDYPRNWSLSADISSLPRLAAPGAPLLEAVYALSLEEALADVRTDGAFMAGQKWPGVWTRDISYSIDLSLAWILPGAARKSLEAKLSPDGRIIQDTGTGGSWPVSTDRVVWALAAWQLWLSSGDRAWLEEAYPILKAAAEQDRAVAYDPRSGLYRGETSFLDWREQSYPRWMEPADIYESKALGTNVLHRQMNAILGRMARALGKGQAEAAEWDRRATALDMAINARLWLPGRGYYSIFAYPELDGGAAADRMDNLGNALAILSGVAPADRVKAMASALPAVPFGPPALYPQLSGIAAYHNRSIWPFVTAYWGLAQAQAGNAKAAAFALESNVRAAALFLTNKENMVFDTGTDYGTAINSDRQLWSVAGQLAGIYRVLFGITPVQEGPQAGGLSFRPIVPEWASGGLELSGLRWRGAVLDLRVKGTGALDSLTVDGKAAPRDWVLPPDAKGSISIEMTMDGKALGGNVAIVSVDDRAPEEKAPALPPEAQKATAEFDAAVDSAGASLSIDLPASGTWALRWNYSNGSGPINTDNKCAIRAVTIDGKPSGSVALPQRGSWSARGLSSPTILELAAGTHRIELSTEAEDRNMDGTVNRAILYGLEAVRLR